MREPCLTGTLLRSRACLSRDVSSHGQDVGSGDGQLLKYACLPPDLSFLSVSSSSCKLDQSTHLDRACAYFPFLSCAVRAFQTLTLLPLLTHYQLQNRAHLEIHAGPQIRAAMASTGLNRVVLVRNAKYKKSGPKSYVYALAKYGINPTLVSLFSVLHGRSSSTAERPSH